MVIVLRTSGRANCCPSCLCLQVLVQRIHGPDSPFAAYIANLPVGVSGVPMFYPREALEALEYPPVVEQVRFQHKHEWGYVPCVSGLFIGLLVG